MQWPMGAWIENKMTDLGWVSESKASFWWVFLFLQQTSILYLYIHALYLSTEYHVNELKTKEVKRPSLGAVASVGGDIMEIRWTGSFAHDKERDTSSL